MLRLPLLIDAHVHLDKTMTIERTGRVTGGLHASIERCLDDAQCWDAKDIATRADRALRRAFSHGTCALRTHVDWTQPDEPLAWGVLTELAQHWRAALHLELVSLQFPELYDDLDWARRMAKRVQQTQGVLGAFVHAQPRLSERLDALFRVASEHGLRIDLHCDEGIGDHLTGFDIALDLTERYQLQGRVVCSHLCALAQRESAVTQQLFERAAQLQVGMISLPTTNLYLQDRPFEQPSGAPVRTPRLRGIAPVHEARRTGMSVAFASDNCRDPFYPYGDYRLLDVLATAALAVQLDPASDWVAALTTAPAAMMGVPDPAHALATHAIEIDALDLDDALSRIAPYRVIRPAHQVAPSPIAEHML
jgi:cytosine deaminase